MKLTWLELDPDSCVVLYFLDHLPISPDDNSDSKPWDGNLNPPQRTG